MKLPLPNALIARLPLERQRRRRLAAAPRGPLADFLATPFPAPDTDLRALRCLAVDFETTGGDARRDAIVSVGWVAIDALRIELSTATHRLVAIPGEVGAASAVVHRITDDEAAGGVPPAEAIAALLAALAGRVLIAHHAATEVGFLAAACRRLYGADIVVPALDTLALAARWRRDARPGDLRLSALRRHHGLPRYPVHHALSDALSAAELYLALVAGRQEALPWQRYRAPTRVGS
jgi:DNA polymerase-3 subunit epsilon